MSLRDSVNRTLPIELLLKKLKIKVDETGFIACPFHAENRPSLKVYGGKKGWYCYSCKKGGGSVEFYAHLRSKRKETSFDEAAQILSRKFAIRSSLVLDVKENEEREKWVSLVAALEGWERRVCQKFIHAILEQVHDKELKSNLFCFWMGYGWRRLDEAIYLSIKFCTTDHLEQVEKDIEDALLWVVESYSVRHISNVKTINTVEILRTAYTKAELRKGSEGSQGSGRRDEGAPTQGSQEGGED